MKHVLIIKTSSLGDVLHTLPALTDAGSAIPAIRFDWVVEEAFAEVPTWHPLVGRVIPVTLRKWRRKKLEILFNGEIKKFVKKLREQKYDAVIDLQGLIKSAVITRLARGERIGLDVRSLTERLARFAYQKTVTVDLKKHAIWRMRALMAQALDYKIPDTKPHISWDTRKFEIDGIVPSEKYICFIHATTWPAKRWPLEYWIKLAALANDVGFTVCVPWSSKEEYEFAKTLASLSKAVNILPRMNLTALAAQLFHAQAVVTVDTGIGHLASLLGCPTVALYGPTDPARIGIQGSKSYIMISNNTCIFCDEKKCKKQKIAECMQSITPDMVWDITKRDLII